MVSDLYRQMRPSCSDCGKGGLEWMNPVQLVRRLDSASGRESVREAIAAFGTDTPAWLCPACSHWGVFGPLEDDSIGMFA